MRQKNIFTTKEIATKLRIHEKTLSYWVKKGVLVPGVYAPSGRGTTRLFDSYNAFEASIVRELTKDELPLSFIKQILAVLRQGQCLKKAELWFSEGISQDNLSYLVCARDYGDLDDDAIELVEVTNPGDYEKLHFQYSERVLVFNLSVLLTRIFAEVDGLGLV